MIELHLHLEGAMPPEFCRRLAAEKHVDVSGIFDERGGYAFRGFDHFLKVYEAATSVLRGPEDYARLTAAVLEELEGQGVRYAEVFVSPDFCGAPDRSAWAEHVEAIGEAIAASPVEMRLIATCIRHFGPERAKDAARCAAETAGGLLTGWGMGGAETVGRAGDYAWAFDCAREAGLRLTSHAGEWGGPESVRETLDDLRVERVGHGVRAVEDPALVERLAEDGIVLEICPGSNLALGIYPAPSAHPIATLRDAGVTVTVSTDDPPFFHTDMANEREILEEGFGWGDEDWAALQRAALDAAFCDEDTKERLRAEWTT